MSDTPIKQNGAPFWETKSLSEMSQKEWEALCDGCGKCCIILLEDEDTDEVWETDIACKLFDQCERTCRDYSNRKKKVPGCVKLTPDNVAALDWMPQTCAYRLLNDGKPLPEWHHLITDDRHSIVEAGASVKIPLHHEDDIPEEYTEDHVTIRRC